jgi:hypothetical protein
VNGERSEYGQWPWQISLRQWRTGTIREKKYDINMTFLKIGSRTISIFTSVFLERKFHTIENSERKICVTRKHYAASVPTSILYLKILQF